MSIFRLVSLASPLFLGPALLFLLALGCQRKWTLRRRVGVYAAASGAWVIALGGLSIFSSEPVVRWLKVGCFLLAFAAFLYGLFHLIVGLGLPPAGAQVAASFLLVAMVGTVFYFDPILEEAEERGHDLSSRIEVALEWNPYLVMALSIFEDDVFTHRALYTRTQLAHLQRPYPDWARTALWFVLLGFWFQIGAVLLRALRRRRRDG